MNFPLKALRIGIGLYGAEVFQEDDLLDCHVIQPEAVSPPNLKCINLKASMY